MTDRRSHWTDDLIEAVIALQYHCVDCMEDDYPDVDPRDHRAVNLAWACSVIAAVEDWYRHNYKSDTTFIDLPSMLQDQARAKRVEQAEAAIQRVRAIGERTKALYRDERDYDDGWNACRDAVRSALDGDSDD